MEDRLKALETVQDSLGSAINKINDRLDRLAVMLKGTVYQRKDVEGYSSSEQTDKLDEAFAKAQAKFKVPTKSKQNKFRGQNYSGVEDLLQAVLPALNEFGVSLKQGEFSHDGEHYLRTILRCQGQFEQVTTQLIITEKKDLELNQSLGSSMTYQRRYALSSFLGIGGADDNDPDDPEVKTEKPAVQAKPAAQANPRLEHVENPVQQKFVKREYNG